MKKIKTLLYFLFFITCVIACRNSAPGKDMGINGNDTNDIIADAVADTFRSTSSTYTEYTSFEINEKGYDPCELLTMQSITATCKPTSAVSIYNHNQKTEKSCMYSWLGTDGNICQVSLTILAYSLDNEKMKSLFKPDAEGIIYKNDTGVRWLEGNKIFTVSYVGEVIKKVNILTVKSHVKPIK